MTFNGVDCVADYVPPAPVECDDLNCLKCTAAATCDECYGGYNLNFDTGLCEMDMTCPVA
jgi:hypothetical protein